MPQPEGLNRARIELLYTVFIEDLQFYGYHGVSPEERQVGHRFHVSVRAIVNRKIPQTDNVEDTVDYSRLADVLVGVGTGSSFKTVEALAALMCESVLNEFPLVEDVYLNLAKFAPPIPHTSKFAGVHVARTRSQP